MTISKILHVLFFGYSMPSEMVDQSYPVILQRMGGLELSLVITCLSLALAVPIGLALMLSRTYPRRLTNWREVVNLPFGKVIMWFFFRGLQLISAAVVEVIRGIPIMLLALLVFYLPYPLWGVRVPPVILAVVVFTAYGAVYFSEIFRSGFRAVDDNWIDASCVLGLNSRQVLLYIKLPIALRAMLPDALGLFITMFKDTSVLVAVAVPELTYSGRMLQVAEPVHYALVLFLIIIIYWSVSFAGSVLVHLLEKRWKIERVWA